MCSAAVTIHKQTSAADVYAPSTHSETVAAATVVSKTPCAVGRGETLAPPPPPPVVRVAEKPLPTDSPDKLIGKDRPPAKARPRGTAGTADLQSPPLAAVVISTGEPPWPPARKAPPPAISASSSSMYEVEVEVPAATAASSSMFDFMSLGEATTAAVELPVPSAHS